MGVDCWSSIARRLTLEGAVAAASGMNVPRMAAAAFEPFASRARLTLAGRAGFVRAAHSRLPQAGLRCLAGCCRERPMFEVLIGLAVLAFPVLAIVALVTAVGARDQARALERRLIALERERAQAPAAPTFAPPPAAVPQPPPQPRTQIATPPVPAATVAPPPASPPRPAPAPARTEPKVTFEEQFGTRWVVWAGGIALALGGFFLVRYSIEQDLLR